MQCLANKQRIKGKKAKERACINKMGLSGVGVGVCGGRWGSRPLVGEGRCPGSCSPHPPPHHLVPFCLVNACSFLPFLPSIFCLFAKRPVSVVIDSATYLFTISSPDIDNVAMSLYDIILYCSWCEWYHFLSNCYNWQLMVYACIYIPAKHDRLLHISIFIQL